MRYFRAPCNGLRAELPAIIEFHQPDPKLAVWRGGSRRQLGVARPLRPHRHRSRRLRHERDPRHVTWANVVRPHGDSNDHNAVPTRPGHWLEFHL